MLGLLLQEGEMMNFDEEAFDKYLWELKSDPTTGKIIANALLKKKSPLRKEVINMILQADKFVKR